ncbi:unnamed protein product, partial [Prorocentrum cordatum]
MDCENNADMGDLSEKIRNFYGLRCIEQLRGTQAQTSEGETPDAKKDPQQLEQDMWDELKKGGFFFATRGEKMSGRWARALENDAELATRYKAQIGMVNKSAFRADWASKQYKKFTEHWSKKVSNKKTEKLEGRYLSLARIAHKEGGGADGLKAATTYCTNCVLFGKHWCKFDRMTNTLKFYYVEHSMSDEYSTEVKSPLEIAMQAFRKEKVLYRGLKSQAASQIILIEADPTWKNFNNDQNKGEIERLLKEIEDVVTSTDHLGELLTLDDVSLIKKRVGEQKMEDAVRDGSKEPLSKLKDHIAGILRMYASKNQQPGAKSKRMGNVKFYSTFTDESLNLVLRNCAQKVRRRLLLREVRRRLLLREVRRRQLREVPRRQLREESVAGRQLREVRRRQLREARSWLSDPIPRDLDAFELCCGFGGITREINDRGGRALGMDRRLSDPLPRTTGHPSEDICALPGMLMALYSVLRIRRGGMFWSSPECKTWLQMCSFHTSPPVAGRAKGDLLGAAERLDVQEANHCGFFLRGPCSILACLTLYSVTVWQILGGSSMRQQRRSFLLMIAWGRLVETCTEQPTGSLLIDLIESMAVHPNLKHVTTYLGHFRAPTVNPLTILTTLPRMQWVTGRKGEQKASEKYPDAFCSQFFERVGDRPREAALQFLEDRFFTAQKQSADDAVGEGGGGGIPVSSPPSIRSSRPNDEAAQAAGGAGLLRFPQRSAAQAAEETKKQLTQLQQELEQQQQKFGLELDQLQMELDHARQKITQLELADANQKKMNSDWQALLDSAQKSHQAQLEEVRKRHVDDRALWEENSKAEVERATNEAVQRAARQHDAVRRELEARLQE